MIITRILGGLGNQMFQYAAGRALALASGQDLKLDLTEMGDYRLRGFALDQLCIQAEIAKPVEIPPKKKGSFVNRLKSTFGTGRRRIPRIVETDLTFDPTVLSVRGPVHLEGYWQSEKYFSAIADTIRNEFSLLHPLTPSRQVLLDQIRSTIHPVSVHVRRGDYVSNPSANAVHGTCEPEWYRLVMDRMTQRFGEVSFFIFSDDSGWARENLPSYPAMVFIEPLGDGRDCEDMHLMAACRAHIVANSTFSWWGAWLNPRPDKHVIAPVEWFRSKKHDARDLIPPDWERL